MDWGCIQCCKTVAVSGLIYLTSYEIYFYFAFGKMAGYIIVRTPQILHY